MPQVLEFKLPDLGEGLTEAEIVRWLVEVGDVVAIDQPVVEVETAKAMVEVPCPYGGVVTARFGEEGTELPVGSPLLTVAVGSAEGDLPEDLSGKGAGGAESSGNVLVGYGTGAPAARRRRVRPEAISAAAVPVAEPAPVPVTAPAPAPGPVPAPVPDEVSGPVAVVSPLVRRLARQHDLDLRQLTGSGRDGLILRADVESAIRAAANGTAVAPSVPVPVSPPPRGRRRLRLPGSGLRCAGYGARSPTNWRAVGVKFPMPRAGSMRTQPS